jgi:hypothetical protein
MTTDNGHSVKILKLPSRERSTSRKKPIIHVESDDGRSTSTSEYTPSSSDDTQSTDLDDITEVVNRTLQQISDEARMCILSRDAFDPTDIEVEQFNQRLFELQDEYVRALELESEKQDVHRSEGAFAEVETRGRKTLFERHASSRNAKENAPRKSDVSIEAAVQSATVDARKPPVQSFEKKMKHLHDIIASVRQVERADFAANFAGAGDAVKPVATAGNKTYNEDTEVLKGKVLDAFKSIHIKRNLINAIGDPELCAEHGITLRDLLHHDLEITKQSLATLEANEAAQHQELHNATDSSKEESNVSDVPPPLKENMIPKSSSKVRKQARSTVMDLMYSSGVLPENYAPHVMQTAIINPDEALATSLFRMCKNQYDDFTSQEAVDFIHMCGGDLGAAISLYVKIDDTEHLKAMLNRWRPSHPDIRDKEHVEIKGGENETGSKRTYCESVVSDGTAYSDSPPTEKVRHGVEDAAETAEIKDTESLSGVKKTCPRWCKDVWGCAECECGDNYVKHSALEAPDSRSGEVRYTPHPWGPTQPTRHDISWMNLMRDASFDNPNTTAAGTPTIKPRQPPTNYTVTYWATIEHEEEAIHIPIDSNHVSGLKKSVIEGNTGMKKIWKWIQEKGLGDKVGLQDAFDLAMNIHDQASEEPYKHGSSKARDKDGDRLDKTRFVIHDSEGSVWDNWGVGNRD